MASKWNVDKKQERNKLLSTEDDWNLAGSGKVSGRRVRKPRKFLGDSSSDDDDSYSEESCSSSSSSDEEESITNFWDDRKPPASRVILESVALKELVERNMKCPECGGNEVEMLFSTVTIASTAYMKCKSKECGFIDHSSSPATASLPQFRDNRPRMTDYALNVLYVVAMICNGDGSAEAGRLLGLLGLPNDTTMSTRTFGIIEERIAPVVFTLYNSILVENLTEEVRISFGDNNKNAFDLWKQSQEKRNNIVLQPTNYAKVCGSFDMGWQKRGKQHNSPSGHAFLVGKHTRKPICGDIKSKLCSVCKAYKLKNGKDAVAPPHYCVKNYTGSSGGMEPVACADMLTLLHDSYCVDVELICMDDDSSTRQAIRWNNANYLANNNTDKLPQVPITVGKNKGKLQDRPDRGQLPGHIPEPKCTSDPNHRRKQLTGELLELSMKKVKERLTMTKMDVKRIGKNFGYMAQSLPKMSEDLYCQAAKAVLEHHFNCWKEH